MIDCKQMENSLNYKNPINNMEKRSNFLVLLFLLLFSLTFVSSVPPVTTQFVGDLGLNIEASFQPYYKINEPAQIQIHVFNKTNGRLLDNITASCEVELTDFNGTILIHATPPFEDNHFLMTRSKDIITEVGIYAITIICNSSDVYGWKTTYFEATKTGKGFDIEESLVYFILAFGVLILFALSFYFMIATEYGNEIDERGAVIKVTKLKYVKLALILLTWVLFTWFLNILIGLSDNFVSLTMYYGFFGFMFTIMNAVALPLGVVIIVIMLFEIIRDANIMENIKKFGSSYK